MIRHPCYDQTRIVCAVCGAQAHLCGVVGISIERMQRVVEAAREWLAADAALAEEQAFGDSGADLCDVDKAVTRARARVADALAALNGDAS